MNTQTPHYASCTKRLLAGIYDFLLIISLLFVATGIFIYGLTDNESVRPGHPLFPIYLFYLFSIGFLFYGWFLTKSGQTLGMRTWRIYLRQETGYAITWGQALIRFSASLTLLSFFFCFFSNKKQAWHDSLTQVEVLQIPKKKK